MVSTRNISVTEGMLGTYKNFARSVGKKILIWSKKAIDCDGEVAKNEALTIMNSFRLLHTKLWNIINTAEAVRYIPYDTKQAIEDLLNRFNKTYGGKL